MKNLLNVFGAIAGLFESLIVLVFADEVLSGRLGYVDLGTGIVAIIIAALLIVWVFSWMTLAGNNLTNEETNKYYSEED